MRLTLLDSWNCGLTRAERLAWIFRKQRVPLISRSSKSMLARRGIKGERATMGLGSRRWPSTFSHSRGENMLRKMWRISLSPRFLSTSAVGTPNRPRFSSPSPCPPSPRGPRWLPRPREKAPPDWPSAARSAAHGTSPERGRLPCCCPTQRRDSPAVTSFYPRPARARAGTREPARPGRGGGGGMCQRQRFPFSPPRSGRRRGGWLCLAGLPGSYQPQTSPFPFHPLLSACHLHQKLALERARRPLDL